MRLEGVMNYKNYMDFTYALAATVFFSIIAVALLVLGDHTTRVIVLAALVFGAMSQFLAQDGRPFVMGISIALSWAAMAMTIAAVIGFALLHG